MDGDRMGGGQGDPFAFHVSLGALVVLGGAPEL